MWLLRSIPSVVTNIFVANNIPSFLRKRYNEIGNFQTFRVLDIHLFQCLIVFPQIWYQIREILMGAYIPFEKRSSRGYLMHAYQVDCTVLSPICDSFRRKRHETLRWCFSRYVDIRSWKRLRIFYVIVLLCLGGEIIWEFCRNSGVVLT